MTKNYDISYHFHDVLIIGAGGAGLRAAISAKDNGADVAIISKTSPFHSHTAAAQGGINAALGNVTKDDWRWHAYDTIKGSDWLGDQDAIAYMCKQAPAAIAELEDMGMKFSHDESGNIYQRPYGGASTEYGKGETAVRACAASDQIGNAMVKGLTQHIADYDIDFFVEYLALDLIMKNEDEAMGVLAWELATGKLHIFLAHETIIATGGYSQIYASTTSSASGTGDGGAMALRAGIPLEDMEYIQFHPTGLYPSGILISEASRGEGGYLLNGDGERFMQDYAPEQMELASRDIVSRAIMSEITDGRGAGENKNHVLLDLSHISEEIINQQLPTVQSLSKWFTGKDMAKEPIPVIPTVHYTMGGIPSNLQCEVVTGSFGRGDKTIKGLRAIGEASCNSVHGANRLGCNSLLDLVVFGKYAGEQSAKTAKTEQTSLSKNDIPQGAIDKSLAHFDKLRFAKGHKSPHEIRNHVQNTMQKYCGIIRDKQGLEEGIYQLHLAWLDFTTSLNVDDDSLIWNNSLIAAIETENILQQALVTMASAANRTESRGAHFRSDHPNRNDQKWLKHSIAKLHENGFITITYRPVRLDPEITGMEKIAVE